MDWFFVFIARTLTSRFTLDRGKTMNKIAIIQRPPVLLNRSATLAVAVESVGEAAAAGAKLIVLPETFIPGYPSWIWRLAPGRDGALIAELHARLLANAVDLATGELDALCEVARGHRVTVVCGLNECERSRGGGTLYNTVVVIDPDGKLRNRHRKLMPTNPERMVHGLGDASGLRAVDTPVGSRGRTHLLGELYAAGALRTLRRGGGSLRGAHL